MVAATGDYASENNARENVFLRYLADTLVLLRFLIAGFIVLLAFFVGQQAFNLAIISVFFGEILDSFDGSIAKSSGIPQTFLGSLDWPADLVLVYSFFLFLVITGLYPIIPALAIAIASLAIVLWRPRTSIVDMVTAPIFALPIVLSFHAGLIVGIAYVGFVLTLLIVRWDRVMTDAKRAHLEASGSPED